MYFLTPGGRSIPYSEFKSLVKNGQVAEVTIGDQTIRGTLKQPAGDDKSKAVHHDARRGSEARPRSSRPSR